MAGENPENDVDRKRAIVVLTRGYLEWSRYEVLIKRNIHIAKNLHDKSIPCCIFHEGNILARHQEYIRALTPDLDIRFIDAGSSFRKTSPPVYEPTQGFGLGYRNMCSFWFVGFWNYLQSYDEILRIDEDCLIDFDIDDCFSVFQEGYVCLYGMLSGDEPYVTKGLNQFTLEFLQRETGQDRMPQSVGGPYTNVIGLNLALLRKNELLGKYIGAIKASDNIYTYRWGDLPLWGEVMKYFLQEADHKKLENIRYYHGSHQVMVNGP